MSESIDPCGQMSAMQSEFSSALKLFTRTAEMLATDLRDFSISLNLLETRTRALDVISARMMHRLRRAPGRADEQRGDISQVSALNEDVRALRSLTSFIISHAKRPDVERDVLAEYVDALQKRAEELRARLARLG